MDDIFRGRPLGSKYYENSNENIDKIIRYSTATCVDKQGHGLALKTNSGAKVQKKLEYANFFRKISQKPFPKTMCK